MKLNENIKTFRKEKNLRQEQLAEAMGVSTASVSKWETGQCAPELSVLMELADFFQVSIDTLMGHDVDPQRMDFLIQAMEQAVNNRDEDGAVALCQRILRNYPNDAHAVKACADCYYRLFVFFNKVCYMHLCIQQTQRLTILNQDEPERDRLTRIRDLANHYALIDQWERAREYYEQSNVCQCNRANIALCLLRQKQYPDAVTMLSEELTNSIFSIFQAVNSLSEGWQALGQHEKAIQALSWVAQMMDTIHYKPTIRILVQIELAAIYQNCDRQEDALDAMRKAAQLTNTCQPTSDFLSLKKEPEFLISTTDDRALLRDVAQKMGTAYVDAIEEVLE